MTCSATVFCGVLFLFFSATGFECPYFSHLWTLIAKLLLHPEGWPWPLLLPPGVLCQGHRNQQGEGSACKTACHSSFQIKRLRIPPNPACSAKSKVLAVRFRGQVPFHNQSGHNHKFNNQWIQSDLIMLPRCDRNESCEFCN